MPKQIKNTQSGNRAARLCRSYANPNFALLAEIRREVAPIIRAREMAVSGEMPDDGFDNTPFCHYVASGEMGEVQTKCGRGYMPALATTLEGDSDDDLSLSNSLLCETPKADFTAKDGAQVQ